MEAEGSEGEVGEGGDDTDKEPDAASDGEPDNSRSPYVLLSCVHCKEKCATYVVSRQKKFFTFYIVVCY